MESLESMDIREAAQYLHRSERSLRRYLQDGRLEHSKEALPAGGAPPTRAREQGRVSN